MKITEIKRDEFNRVTGGFPQATFYQTQNWAVLKSYTGWSSLALGYENDKGELKAAGMFLLKKMPLISAYLCYCPRGFLMDYSDTELLRSFVNDLKKYLKTKHVFELIIDPFLPLNKRDIDGNIVMKENEDGTKEALVDNTDVVDELKSLGFRHNGFNLYYENLQPRWMFKLYLKDRSYEEIFNGFRYEAKRRAKKKDLFAITVREMSEEEIPVFKNLMEDTAKRRGFLDRSLGYYKQMYKALSPKILRYMVAEMDVQKCRSTFTSEKEKQIARIEKLKQRPEKNAGRIKEEEVTLNSYNVILEQLDSCEKKYGAKAPLSVVCLLSYGKEAIMLLAGNDEDYLQHFNTSNIIVAELIRLAKEEGYDYYNFYGISGDFNPEYEGYGLYTYKKQYGGEVSELIGQFEMVISPVMETLYRLMLKAYSLTKRH